MEFLFQYLLQDTGLNFWSFALLCGVSFFGSLITATLGLGGGMLTLATMAMFLPPAVLIPVHGGVQLGSNIGRSVLMRKHVLLSLLPMFFLGGILGALVGGNLVVTLPIPVLKFVLAIFVLYSVWAPKFQASNPGQKTFFVVGLVSSFVTMFVGATGPLVAPFVRASTQNRQETVATHAVMMTMQHCLKLITFGFLGFAFGPYIPLLAGLIAFGFAGTFVGKKLLNKLPEKTFQISLNIILTLMALRLLYSAVM